MREKMLIDRGFLYSLLMENYELEDSSSSDALLLDLEHTMTGRASEFTFSKLIEGLKTLGFIEEEWGRTKENERQIASLKKEVIFWKKEYNALLSVIGGVKMEDKENEKTGSEGVVYVLKTEEELQSLIQEFSFSTDILPREYDLEVEPLVAVKPHKGGISFIPYKALCHFINGSWELIEGDTE